MKRLATGIFCALLLQSALTLEADARPRQSHRAAHQRVLAQTPPEPPSFFEGFATGFSGSVKTGTTVVDAARGYVGMKATEIGVRTTLWCSAFLRKITGAEGVNDTALSWEKKPAIRPQVGAIVTMKRRGGGHVGVVSGFTPKGDPVVISGNSSGRKVTEQPYPLSRIRKWVSAQ